MTEIYILFAMIFAHIVDDFYLQGILAKMKQKDWWEKQDGYRRLYSSIISPRFQLVFYDNAPLYNLRVYALVYTLPYLL